MISQIKKEKFIQKNSFDWWYNNNFKFVFLNIISILASYNFIGIDSNLMIKNDLIIFGFLFFSIGYLDDRYDLKPLSKTVITSIIFLFFLYLNEDFLINKLSFSFTNYEIIFETFETRYFITLFVF